MRVRAISVHDVTERSFYNGLLIRTGQLTEKNSGTFCFQLTRISPNREVLPLLSQLLKEP
jgi:hypothetical protein